MTRDTAIVWSLAVCAGGIGVLISTGVDYWYSSESRNWPAVPGQILVSDLREGPKSSYRVDVRYSYEAKGKRHVGATVRIGPEIESLDDAQAAVSRFPAGKKVSVYVSPDDPKRSVLEPGALPGAWLAKLAVGFALACVGSAFAFAAWRAR